MFTYSDESIRMNIQFPDAAVVIEAAHIKHELQQFKAADISLCKSLYKVSIRVNLSHDMYLTLKADAPLVGSYRSALLREPVSGRLKKVKGAQLSYCFQLIMRSKNPDAPGVLLSQQVVGPSMQSVILKSLVAAQQATDVPVRLLPKKR